MALTREVFDRMQTHHPAAKLMAEWLSRHDPVEWNILDVAAALGVSRAEAQAAYHWMVHTARRWVVTPRHMIVHMPADSEMRAMFVESRGGTPKPSKVKK